MLFRTTALSAAALLLPILAFAQGEASRSSRTWEVGKYTIEASLPDSDSVRQVALKTQLALRNVSTGTAQGLTLRISPSAEVAAVFVNGVQTDFSKGEEKVGAGSLQRIIVRGLSVPPRGTVSVEVSYKLKVDENSGLAAVSAAGTQLLPLSYWYPTPTSWLFARGADFAPTELRVAGRAGTGVIAPGNAVGSGLFSTGLRIQPFFLAGNWETVEALGVTVYLPKGSGELERRRARAIAEHAVAAREFFSKSLGRYPDAPLRIVAVRRGGGFSGGGVVLLDEGAFRREKLDAQTAVVLADAVAKVWLGNAAEVTGDGYGAVREGLARFLATQFVESVFGTEAADVERLRQRIAYGAVSRRDGPITQISPIDDFYFSAMTNKGALIWRRLVRDAGPEKFFGAIRAGIESSRLELASLRSAFPEHKEFLDYAFDQVTDGNLLAGTPQKSDAGPWTVALRNTGPVDVVVSVRAQTSDGRFLAERARIPAKGFGQSLFPSDVPVVRAEVDPEKFELQSDYSDDAAPRLFTESDLVLLVKSSFDRQDFVGAERDARAVLATVPGFDEVRVLLARALLAQGRLADAESEFRRLLEEKLPSSRALAWANAGLGEIAARGGRTPEAVARFEAAISADAELGATVAARRGRARLGVAGDPTDGIREFFALFDKAAVSNRKVELDALIMPGEVIRFSRGISGQAQEWKSRVGTLQRINDSTLLVEVEVELRMINKAPESGSAVYRMFRSDAGWRISGVEAFDVR